MQGFCSDSFAKSLSPITHHHLILNLVKSYMRVEATSAYCVV